MQKNVNHLISSKRKTTFPVKEGPQWSSYVKMKTPEDQGTHKQKQLRSQLSWNKTLNEALLTSVYRGLF